MIIEIKGTGPHNKGAEMMLLSTIQELQKRDKQIIFTIAPNRHEGVLYSFYSKLTLYPKVQINYRGFDLNFLGNLVPKRVRSLFGLIAEKEIDVVLDASGFAYSSQWGDSPAKKMAENVLKWKKQGKKVILLPQAFGPFETDDIKKAMSQIIKYADAIYARDELSYKNLKSINSSTKNIELYQDFTNVYKGIMPAYLNKETHQICIVPNQRMKDKLDKKDDYESFLSKIINKLQIKKYQPFFLIHGGAEDFKLAEKINSLLEREIPIVREESPELIKGIIENSYGIIGSRFHSLASGLYSSIPTLGIGWSHKYDYLFKEFNFSEGLLHFSDSEEEIEYKLDFIMDDDKRKILLSKMQDCNEKLNAKTNQMFSDVWEVIRLA